MSDKNFEALMEKIEEMKEEQLAEVEGSDNKNEDSNLEREQ